MSVTVAVPVLVTIEETVAVLLTVRSRVVTDDVQVAVLEAMLHDTSMVLGAH